MAFRTWLKRRGVRALAAGWLIALAVAGPVTAAPQVVPVFTAAGLVPFPAAFMAAPPAGANPARLPGAPAAADLALNAGMSNAPAMLNNTLNLGGLGYIHIPNAPQLNPPGAITLEAWVRRSGLNCETVVAKDFDTGYWLGFCNNTIRFYADGSYIDGVGTVTAGVWNHVAVAYDGCSIYFYLNGFLDKQEVCITPSPVPVTSDDWAIGANNDTNFKFSGSIAEVRIWRTVRTQADIRRNMLRVIDAADADLAAAWHLEGNASEYLGHFPGTPVGTVAFNGPGAPPSQANPIQVPRLASAPVVNGTCGGAEYGGLVLPIWYTTGYDAYGLRYVSIAATSTDVYVCLALPADNYEPTFASLYLDLNASGGSLPQTNDYRLSGHDDQPVPFCTNEHGNGVNDYTGSNALAGTACAVVDNDEFNWSAEFRFPRSAISGPNGVFGMQFIHHWKAYQGNDYGWPYDFDWVAPSAWGQFVINDSLIIPADSQNPSLSISQRPRPVHQTDAVTIDAVASDDVDIASMELLIGSVVVKSCTFPGGADTSGYCASTPQTFSLGLHGYSARVTDHRGRVGYSPGGSFFVMLDGNAPTISYGHSPRAPGLAGSVTITATATDASGIANLSIALGYGVPGSVTCAANACSTTFAPPAGVRVVYYTVTARDNEGLRASSPNIPILFGNTGTDSDGDGLVNTIETQLCTSPSSADVDGDGLSDGWEVLGLTFGDGSFVNLPALGANPCHRDIYVQYDYERGAHAEPTVWPVIINQFTGHNLTLHLTEFERPRPGSLPTSTVGAEVASVMTTGGHYYMDPKLAWVTHYMYSNHNPGSSGTWHYPTINVNTNNCPLATTDPQNNPACGPRNASDQIYRIVHELGHTLGLGHGGRLGVKALLMQGDVVVYAGGWDNVNFKPNYLSVMNYGYNGVQCYNATTQQWMSSIEYSDTNYGALLESILTEATGSFFYNQVQANPCPASAGFARVFTYSCIDTLGTTWQVTSDGDQMISRQRAGSDAQTTGLPVVPAGIDWNCNGSIAPVSSSGNINGDGGSGPTSGWLTTTAGTSGEVLPSNNDWTNIPYQPSSVCYILNDTANQGPGKVFPTAYINQLGETDCRTSSVTGSAAASSRVGVSGGGPSYPNPDVVHVDPPGTGLAQPFLEQCDGIDNNAEGQVDEYCPDGDSDGLVNALDNCPETPNADQADLNHNYLGDSCEQPDLTSLSFERAGGTVTLHWTGTTSDILGFAVYRLCHSEAGPHYLGASYPSTTGLSLADSAAPNETCSYTVRPVNRYGVEGAGLTVDSSPHQVRLPLTVR